VLLALSLPPWGDLLFSSLFGFALSLSASLQLTAFLGGRLLPVGWDSGFAAHCWH
jgi:hypothetical protein